MKIPENLYFKYVIYFKKDFENNLENCIANSD